MKHCMLYFLMMCFSLTLYAQQISVKGTVFSGEDNLPLPGVTILIKGTTQGTMSDMDGNFTLQAQVGDMLAFSYLGYKGQDIKVADSKPLRVVMAPDIEQLEEVVVIGYGVQKKSVVTAAISRVTADDLNTQKPSRVEDVLKGKVSGVQITQSSGQPGSDSKVRIRGIGTINNSEPLYIVDGMAVEGGINYLNPVDIQSVEILKDAASAAIYGARAANGVVLVTTKGGAAGKTNIANINYDVTVGWQNPWRKKSVLDAKEYMIIMNETQINDGNAPRYTNEQIANAGRGTDWQDETFNYDAPIQSQQLSISGASDKSTYFLSLGYFDQEGIVGATITNQTTTVGASVQTLLIQSTKRRCVTS